MTFKCKYRVVGFIQFSTTNQRIESVGSTMNESIYARDMNTYHNCVPEKIIHEKQSLQLCALHAVNNLLQISQDAEELSAQVEGSQDETFSIVFCAGNYYKCDRKFRKHAFKKEFDEIADKLQQQEKDILLQGSTWLTSFIRTSNHRSFLTGNYSFEASHRFCDFEECPL